MINNGSLCYLSMLTDATPLQPTCLCDVSKVFGAELREVFTQVPHAPLTCRLLSVCFPYVTLSHLCFFISYICKYTNTKFICQGIYSNPLHISPT